MSSWFEVNKEGLAKVLARRGKAFALFELVQNAWDTEATEVNVTLTPVPGRPLFDLVVEDNDPNGFVDLSHAYTLYAESAKKADPTKRGWMNLGDKLVFALCESATIETTTGAVYFRPDGTREKASRRKREVGSVVSARIRMTRDEAADVEAQFHRLIPPEHVKTTLNGVTLLRRQVIASKDAISLQTLVSDEEGNVKRAVRQTTVQVFEPFDGEEGAIYEMGIPVVDTGDGFHVNVLQKVPVNTDRDNVPPLYLRTLRATVLDALTKTGRLNAAVASERWVTEAISDKDIAPEVVNAAIKKRFGEKTAVQDPRDPEANLNLASKGYTVIPGNALPKEAWEHIRKHALVLPSGKIAPTKHPEFSDDPNAPKLPVIPREEWTVEMEHVHDLVEVLGVKLLGAAIEVRFVVDRHNQGFGAWYSRRGSESGAFDFNVAKLGRAFFTRPISDIIDIIVHEFGHHTSGNHASEEYRDALTKMAGQLVVLALQEPTIFRGKFTYR